MIHECFRLASHTQMMSNAKVLDITYVKSCRPQSTLMSEVHMLAYALVLASMAAAPMVLACSFKVLNHAPWHWLLEPIFGLGSWVLLMSCGG